MSLSDYASLVDARIAKLDLDSRKSSSLYEPISYILRSGGKRIRPALLLMTCEAFGGDVEIATDVSAAIEIFHNFTLLHDDVMDKSALRHGKPTVHCKWNENTAILSGDAMLTLAQDLICRTEERIGFRPTASICDIFNRTALKVYEGQALDMEYESEEGVNVDEYMNMIRLKTGALLGGAAEIGAAVAGASEADMERMYVFGEKLGLAFQIQDDYLDVYGDASTFGKSIGWDIINNKKTFLLTSILSGNDTDAEALKEALNIKDVATKIKVVTNIYNKAGIGERCKEMISKLSSEAILQLKKSSMAEDGKNSLRHLLEKLSGRKK